MLAGLAGFAGLTVHLCLLALAYPYQLDYGEGLMLYQAQRLALGQGIYKGIAGYPYIFSNYAPLVQSLVAPFVALLGPSFLPGRLLSLAATIGLAGLLFSMARRAGGALAPALSAALLFLGSPYVYHWAPLFRIDLPALLFSTLGLATLWRGRSTRHVLLAGLLFVLGMFAKQSYIAAPAAALLYLVLYDRAAFRRLLLVLLVAGGVPFVAIELLTQGAFSFGLFTANVNPFSLSLLLAQTRDFVLTFAVIIVLALVGLLRSRQRQAERRLLDVYFLFAVATIVLAGKVGAWENYFLEALFALCLYAGFGIDRLLGEGRGNVVVSGPEEPGSQAEISVRGSSRTPLSTAQAREEPGSASEISLHGALAPLLMGQPRSTTIRSGASAPRTVVSFVSYLLPLALLAQLALMWHDPRLGTQVIAGDGAANRALAPFIQRQSGPILSEDLGLLLVNGKDVPYFSFQYTQLGAVGLWDYAWEKEQLDKQAFSLVVLEKGTREDPDHYRRFSRPVLSEMDRSYALAGEVGKYRLYLPSPVAPLDGWPDRVFGGQIALAGTRVELSRSQTVGGLALRLPGPPLLSLSFGQVGPLRVSLLWQAAEKPLASYKVFVHLEDAAGKRWAQADSLPLSGLYPTDRWQKGELVRDSLDLVAPMDLPAGYYRLRIGLYDPLSGARLRLADGRDSLLLDEIELAPP